MPENQANQNHKSSNPFTEFANESMKMFQDLKIPKVNVEDLIRTHRKNLETLTKAQKTALEALKHLNQAHTDYLKQAFQDVQAHVQDVMNAQSLEEKVHSHTKNLKNGFDRAMKHGHGVAEVLSKTHQEIAGAWQKRFQEGVEEARKMAAEQQNTTVKH